MPDGFDFALRLLPEELRRGLDPAWRTRAEEIRLRCGGLPTVLLGERETPFSARSVTEEMLASVTEAATDSSYHAFSGALRRGYLTAAGGVRVGVCGTAAGDGQVETIRAVSSVSIRIPRQERGAGREIMDRLGGESVLILSPPGAGKTTFLRELVRTVSDRGVRVALADERGEIAAVWHGVPQFDVGKSTDVLTGAPKAEAALMLLRAMNPQVIALDELSDPADTAAAERLAGCGVQIFATVHAPDISALKSMPRLRALLRARVFRQAVVIARAGGRRSYAVCAL